MKTREAELGFHLINSLPDVVSFSAEAPNYSATIAKVRELQLIYSRNNIPQPVSSVKSEERDCLDCVEQSLLQLTEQLYALSSYFTALQPA